MKRLAFTFIIVAVIAPAFGSGSGEEGAPVLGTVVEITPSEGFFQAPAFSPDGSKIIAAGKKFNGIYAIDPDGSGMRIITSEPGAGFRPSFSLDGRKLAFLSRKIEKGSLLGAIKIADMVTGDVVQVTTYAWRRGIPVFYSEKEVLYTLDGKLRKRDIETSIEEVLFENVRSFGFDAKPGRAIVLDEMGYVSLADTTGKSQRVLLSGAGVFMPLISPDSTKVAASESLGFEGHIRVCGLDGKSAIDAGIGYSPAWSQDGKWIAFEMNENDGERFTAGDIWIMKADGFRRTRLTFTDDLVEADPAFSPDGTMLVFGEANTGRLFAAEVTWPGR